MPDHTARSLASPRHPGELAFGPFRFDPANRVLSRSGSEVPLAPKALSVLEYLLERQGQVVSKQDLLDEVWSDAVVEESSLVEVIKVLRHALGDDPRQPTYIQTMHRRGYRFVAPVGVEEATVSEERIPVLYAMALLLQRIAQRRQLIVWSVASLLLGAVAAVLIMRTLVQPSAPTLSGVSRLALALPEGQLFQDVKRTAIALSPDGRNLVYRGPGEDEFLSPRLGGQLQLRPMDHREVQPLPGTERALSPFFSPDGEWVAFWRVEDESGPVLTGTLEKVPLSGGPPVVILQDVPSFLGGSWATDDTIVFSTGGSAGGKPVGGLGLWRVPAVGGTPLQLAAAESDLYYFWPQVLPERNAVLFTLRGYGADHHPAQIAALSLDSGNLRPLVDDGIYGRYLPSGHLVFARDTELLAVAFDTELLSVDGLPTPVLQGVRTHAVMTTAHFAVSNTGTLVYTSAEYPPAIFDLQLIDRRGEFQSLPLPPGQYLHASLSPDGRELLVALAEDGIDIWKYELGRRSSLTRLTFGQWNRNPIWSPDGKMVIFCSAESGIYDLYWMPVDGSRPAEALLPSEYSRYPESWSPDGRVLAFTEVHPETNQDIWFLPLNGGRKPKPFLRTAFDESGASFSPDGTWIAYQSNESGQWEVYLRSVPERLDDHDASGPGRRVRISGDCGRWPVWSHSGKEVFFRDCRGGNSVWTVPVQTEPELAVGEPELLFEASFSDIGSGVDYSVTPDDQQFLMISTNEASLVPRLEIVLNWFEELKRLVPTGH